MRILIVDDDNLTRLALTKTLENVDYLLHSVTNGEQAIRRLCAQEFDAVITDFRMPRMGGLELTASIRTLFGDRLKIVGMSASDDCGKRFLRAGADAYLAKPIEREELLKIIEAFAEEKACPLTTAR